MKRRTIVYAALALSITAFSAGIYWYAQSENSGRSAFTASSSNALLERDYSPVFGPIDAPVTIVEFFDPACETCRAFHPVVKEILEDFEGQVRVIIRYATFHEGSDEVVKMLETARNQGKFEAVLEAILGRQSEWASHGSPDLSQAWEIAERAGLNTTLARQSLNSLTIVTNVQQDASDIAALGIEKTPTFFVNGKPLQEFGMQQLYDLVLAEVRMSQRN